MGLGHQLRFTGTNILGERAFGRPENRVTSTESGHAPAYGYDLASNVYTWATRLQPPIERVHGRRPGLDENLTLFRTGWVDIDQLKTLSGVAFCVDGGFQSSPL
jgi:hypothetical protein